MAHLVLKTTTGILERYNLSKQIVAMGRHSSNDVFVNDDSVSRFHAEIENRGDIFSLRDLDSRNGIMVNDIQVLEKKLEHLDQIKLGNSELTFYLHEDSPKENVESTSPPFEVRDQVKIATVNSEISDLLQERIRKKGLLDELEKLRGTEAEDKTKGRYRFYEIIEYLKNVELTVNSAHRILSSCVEKDDCGEVPAALDGATLTLNNLQTVITNLVLLINDRALPVSPCDVNCVVKDVVHSIEPTAKSMNIQLQTDLDESLPDIEFNSFVLYNSLMSIARNSLEAMQGKEDAQLVVSTEMGDGGEVSIIVQDNGNGIRETDGPGIFDPFFTTKGPDFLGMGLCVAKVLIQGSNGRIEFDSEENLGTTFVLILPVGN